MEFSHLFFLLRVRFMVSVQDSVQNNWKPCNIFTSLLIRFSGLTDYVETIIVYSHWVLMLLCPVATPKRGLEI